MSLDQLVFDLMDLTEEPIAKTDTEKPVLLTNTPPLWALPQLGAYTLALESTRAWKAYLDEKPNSLTGEAVSMHIIDAAIDVLPENGLILVGSSTGKDSTVTAAMVVKVLLQRRREGRRVPETIIGIAHTKAEFPLMDARISSEAAHINNWGVRENLPIRAVVKSPPPKDRLLVEILGNGKPVPKRASGKAADGMDAAGWCMDRVKGGPINAIIEEDNGRPALHIIGTRQAESSRRKASMGRHSDGFPFGLSHIEGTNRLGVCPVLHWENKWIKDWGSRNLVPWNIESFDELREIYAIGSDSDALAEECGITITNEGKVSNTCSDLAGTRYGCWMCLLSVNNSLKNTARKDARYRWLRGFHAWIYNHHRRNERRRKLIKASHLTKTTCFPKNMTFEERYFGLMLVRRAEIHSGFTLLNPGDMEAIEAFWKKSGVVTVDTTRLDEDVLRWIKTGKVTPHWKITSHVLGRTGASLGEGIPGGAYFHLIHRKLEGHKRGTMSLTNANLTPLIGWGMTPIFPVLQTYIFTDTRIVTQSDGTEKEVMRDRVLVMVTDTPSTLGAKTNTGLLNGIAPAGWTLRGVRPPTQWERTISDGRNFFYEYGEATLKKSFRLDTPMPNDGSSINKMQQTQILASLAENLYHYAGLGQVPCHRWWEEHLEQIMEASEAKLTEEQLMDAFRLTAAVVLEAETLCDAGERIKGHVQYVTANKRLLLENSPEIRTELSQFFNEVLPVTLETYLAWAEALKQLVAKYPHPALLDRLAFAVRMTPVDPAYAEEYHNETRRILRLPEKAAA